MLLVADLLPNTESKSTLRPVELGGWVAGGAEKPVLKKIKKHHRLVHLHMFEEFQRTEMSKQWLMFPSSSRVIHNWHN